MAEVAAPIVPLRLYRYRNIVRSDDALAQELGSICGNELYCSSFSAMNDPMEGFFNPSDRIRLEPNYQRALDRLRDRKADTGIACFSETYEDVLMWTHYAGNHKGICAAYSSRRLKEGLDTTAQLVRVAYVDAPARITGYDLRNTLTAARKVLSQKRYNWSYEREWRVLAHQGLNLIRGPVAVTDLYLGSRIGDEAREAVLRAAQHIGARVYSMRVVDYRHEWEASNEAAAAKPLTTYV